jgi:hypothetical protein
VLNTIYRNVADGYLILAGTGAVRLRNGRVLAVLRQQLRRSRQTGPRMSAELYNPVTKTWKVTRSMDVTRSEFTTTLLPDGHVLVTGGWADAAYERAPGCTTLPPAADRAELFTP